MLVWPPREHHELRERTAALSRALAALLAADAPSRDDARAALTALRQTFRSTSFRPVGLTTGSRLIVRLVDELEWVHGVMARARVDSSTPLPAIAADMRAAVADVLLACSCELAHDDASHEGSCPDLDDCLRRLAEQRRAVAQHPLDVPTWSHQIGYATSLVGETVAAIAAADARPLLARLAGRRPETPLVGTLSAVERRAAGHLARHSVWLHNSLRGAAGLAAAVLIAEVVGVQYGFWVVLGAMSVLRSNALSTGSTVLRAMAGTVAGFAIGGLLVGAIGTDPNVLWALLPIAVFVAGFAPDAVSFAAGQAAFTVVVIILFNIIHPVGWTVGLLRIEDVALGCAASLAAGVLFWPRGAAVAMRHALADGYRAAADYLVAAIGYITQAAPPPVAEHARTRATALRLDDAFRQYLAERGAKHVPLASVTTLANGVGQLHFVADAVGTLRHVDDGDDRGELSAESTSLLDEARQLRAWYTELADLLGDPRRVEPGLVAGGVAAPDGHRTHAGDAVRRSIGDGAGSNSGIYARRIYWSNEYLDDIGLLRTRLVGPITEVAGQGGKPWWQR
jgi:uncharacterized membrane protein YccC